MQARCQFRAMPGNILSGFHHFGKTLIVFIQASRTHNHHRFICRHSGIGFREALIVIIVHRERIENHSHIGIFHDAAFAAHPLQPSTHCHEMDRHPLIEPGFAGLSGGGKVVCSFAR